MNLIKKLFIATLLTLTAANANCTGGACMASLDFLPQTKASETKDTKADSDTYSETYVVINEVNLEENALAFSEAAVAVQVGAFRSYAQAKNSAKKYTLAGDQFRADIVKARVNNKTFYKVQIKGFESRKEANLFAASYRNIGAFLVTI